MLDTQKTEKIKKFMADKLMSDAVTEVLTNSYLSAKSNDVQYLAAQMIAVNLFKDGFKELTRISKVENKPEERTKQIGL